MSASASNMVAEHGSNPPAADEAEVLTNQIAGDNDATEDYQHQPSNTNARIEGVGRSISELDESVKGRPRWNEEVVDSRRDVGGKARGDLGRPVVGEGATPEEQGRGNLGHSRGDQVVER